VKIGDFVGMKYDIDRGFASVVVGKFFMPGLFVYNVEEIFCDENEK
jgi:hypothetical protein